MACFCSPESPPALGFSDFNFIIHLFPGACSVLCPGSPNPVQWRPLLPRAQHCLPIAGEGSPHCSGVLSWLLAPSGRRPHTPHLPQSSGGLSSTCLLSTCPCLSLEPLGAPPQRTRGQGPGECSATPKNQPHLKGPAQPSLAAQTCLRDSR